MDWFRMYGEFASDPKVQSMSEVNQRRLMMLFCLRCSNTLVTLHDDEIAFALRISEEDLAASKAIFVRKGFVDENWILLNWDKRQFVSDSSRERVSKCRANKKAAEKQAVTTDVTPCNVTVTPQNRTEAEQIQNRIEQKHPAANISADQPVQPIQSESNSAHGVTAANLSIALRSAGIQSQPADPRLIELAKQGVTPETMLSACSEAATSKPGVVVGVGYILKIIERWTNEAGKLSGSAASLPPRGVVSQLRPTKFNPTAHVNRNRVAQ
ncbi:MAG: hypothetical protein NTY70_12980 [Burkholderiales bacterium]|nr:hypothetical protein [Burkholderiales bacterium]